MRKYWCLLLLIVCWGWQLAGAEQVIFIPGWYSEWINYREHRKILRDIFPKAEIQVRKWDSNRLWKNAKLSAAECADELCQDIRKNPVPGNCIIIGHSLGGYIAVKTAAILASENIRLKQIILLGSAAVPSAQEFEAVRQVSLLPAVNIFCSDDAILKLYISKEKKLPLGFAGLARKTAHFQQYRLVVDEQRIKIGEISLPAVKLMGFFRDSAAHLAANYLQCLQLAVSGKIGEYYLDLAALEKIAAYGAGRPGAAYGFKTVETVENWLLEQRRNKKIYRIVSPSGRKFYYPDETAARRKFKLITGYINQAKQLRY